MKIHIQATLTPRHHWRETRLAMGKAWKLVW